MTKTAVVTGGARGLGLAMAERLVHDGWQVVAWDASPRLVV